MIKVLGGIGMKLGKMFASCALAVGIISVNAPCIIWYHQPKVLQGMNRFKR